MCQCFEYLTWKCVCTDVRTVTAHQRMAVFRYRISPLGSFNDIISALPVILSSFEFGEFERWVVIKIFTKTTLDQMNPTVTFFVEGRFRACIRRILDLIQASQLFSDISTNTLCYKLYLYPIAHQTASLTAI
jgi:hypothetical protein